LTLRKKSSATKDRCFENLPDGPVALPWSSKSTCRPLWYPKSLPRIALDAVDSVDALEVYPLSRGLVIQTFCLNWIRVFHYSRIWLESRPWRPNIPSGLSDYETGLYFDVFVSDRDTAVWSLWILLLNTCYQHRFGRDTIVTPKR